MDHFDYRNGELYCDGVSAADLCAAHGTPLYVYSAATIRHHFNVLTDAFARAEHAPLICYSVKANSNLSILRLLAAEGAGFDVVSGGELRRVLEVGGDPQKVVYAGVGKKREEIRAAVDAVILLFNVESASELERIDECAGDAGRVVGVAIRINPDVDPKTHRYITTGKRENKFGVDLVGARDVVARTAELANVECRGLHVHLGSQITDTAPYVEGVRRVVEFLGSDAAGVDTVRWLDIGGGFGIHYKGREALPATAFAAAILPELEGSGLRLILEPGRFIMGNAGALLTRIVTLKTSGARRFAICDAGMNDLIRPSLYQSYHRIWPAVGEAPPDDVDAVEEDEGAENLADIVGPICETGDFLGLGRELPEVNEGDVLSVFSAGAYGFTMASNYNTRPRAAEVLVDGTAVKVIRRRETYDDLVAPERDL